MLEPGDVVEDYRIERVIGVGGMGVVYEAIDTSLANRRVALKLIASQFTKDADFRARFKREAETQAGVDHPHIITVYRAGESPQGLYIAMRLVDGASLEQLIQSKQLSPARTARLLTQIAGALDAAHEAGLIHRDIKPSNILVDVRRDHAYLADFGITKARGGSRLTHTGRAVGTPDYMSPEQFRGGDLTHRSDVYSLAAVLFECLGGRVPFPKDSDVAVMYAHLSEPPPRLTESRPDLPPATDDVIKRAMAKDPGERHASATDLIVDFEQALHRPTPTIPSRQPTPPDDGGSETSSAVPADRTAPATPAAGSASSPAFAATRLAGTPVGEAAVSVTPPVPVPSAPAGPEAPAEDTAPPFEAVPETVVPARPEETPPERPGAPPTVHSPRRATEPATPPAAAPAAGVATRAATPHEVAADRAVAPPAAARRQPAVPLVAAAAAVLLAVAAGAFVLGQRGEEAAPEPTAVQTAGGLNLSPPTGWVTATGSRLGLRNAVTLSLDDDAGSARLTAGHADAGWPMFLPAGFRYSDTGRREIVRLGKQRLEAFRYSGVSRSTTSGMTVYVVPQPKGVTVLACSAQPAASTALLRRCEQAVGTVSLTGASPYPLTVPASYASAVRRAFAGLDRSRARGLRDLRAAKTRAGQSQAAARIAAAYRTALRAVQRTRPTAYVAPVHSPVVAALSRTRNAYRRMAAAARPPAKPAAYQRARASAASAEAALRTTVRDLRTVGFSVR